jgi:phosphatidylglycerol lysyltransferase
MGAGKGAKYNGRATGGDRIEAALPRAGEGPAQAAAPEAAVRERVLSLLRLHGWNATSFQVLEPAFRYWFCEAGCVAYVESGGAWVVAGAPIGASEEIPRIASAFERAALEQARRVVYFGVEERFLRLTRMRSAHIGEQAEWDPRRWPESVAASASLREQLRRARAKGVGVRCLSNAEVAGGPLRAAIEDLIARWLAGKPMAPMGFLVDVQPFLHPEERRSFAAERDGVVLGFLSCVPIYGRGGWLFEDLLRAPEAPNGTTELLVDAAMRRLESEGATHATLGLAPLAGPVPHGLRFARYAGRWLYDFDGLRAFRARLRPHAWRPIFLAWPRGTNLAIALYDSLRAFAHGSFTRFGLRTLLRGPALLAWALLLLLVLWLPLLAAAPAAWFPSPGVQRAWVLFDLALLLGFWSLMRRWRRPLAALLLALVSLDALATCAEALLFNLRRVTAPWQLAPLAIACAGPLFAAFSLWAMLRTRGAAPLSPLLPGSAAAERTTGPENRRVNR